MAGVEVVMLVTGIIGAFASTASYLQERKKRKAEKSQRKRVETRRLQISVNEAPSQIRHEYDADFARIGPQFASGDAIAREQLTRILLNMQQQMIAALEQQLCNGSAAVQVNTSSLFEHSERSRLDSISALMHQYQRLCTAAPIQRTLSDPSLVPARASSSSETSQDTPTSTANAPACPSEPAAQRANPHIAIGKRGEILGTSRQSKTCLRLCKMFS